MVNGEGDERGRRTFIGRLERVGEVRAVELLDEGRSLLWSEMRRFREPLFLSEVTGDELATRFDSIRSELQDMSTAEARYESSCAVEAPSNAGGRSTTGISYDLLLSRKRKLLKVCPI